MRRTDSATAPGSARSDDIGARPAVRVGERYIVVVVERRPLRALRWRLRGPLGALGAFLTLAAVAAVAAAEQLQRLGNDLGRVAILTILVLPLSRADTAFDVDGAAFHEVLAGDLGKATEQRDAMPLGFLLLLSVLLPGAGGCDR